MKSLKNNLIGNSIIILLLLSANGCKKNDVICLTCQGVIVRYIYTAPTDTMTFDYALQFSPPLAPYNDDFYVREGYRRTVDTLQNTSIHYTACYDKYEYINIYNDNPYFFDNYCVRQ